MGFIGPAQLETLAAGLPNDYGRSSANCSTTPTPRTRVSPDIDGWRNVSERGASLGKTSSRDRRARPWPSSA